MQKADFKSHIETLPKPDFSSGNNTRAVESVEQRFDIDEVWKAIKEQLRMYITDRNMKAFFSEFYLEKIESGVAVFSCVQAFKKEWIEDNHRNLLRDKLKQTTGQKLDILITLRKVIEEKKEPSTFTDIKIEDLQRKSELKTLFESINDPETQKAEAISKAHINPKYTFNSFIVGNNNKLAHAVAEAVAAELGTLYNPVFYYGASGVGKTHLMQAIGNLVLEKSPEKKVMYVPIENFLNELIESIRTKQNENFRQRYRKVDLLIIDDIQYISKYGKTKEEVFHTFNTLYQANKQIILASDRPPGEIEDLPDRLKSRFSGGMVVDILPPDYETRMAILSQRVSDSGIQVPANLIEIVATNIESNIRELEGAITKVISLIKLTGSIPQETDILRMLQIDIESKRKKVSSEKVLQTVGKVFDLPEKDIIGKRRTAYVALARQIVMYLLREELAYSLERIAKEVKRKDHTTVIHACDKILQLSKDDQRIKDKIDLCKRLLYE